MKTLLKPLLFLLLILVALGCNLITAESDEENRQSDQPKNNSQENQIETNYEQNKDPENLEIEQTFEASKITNNDQEVAEKADDYSEDAWGDSWLDLGHSDRIDCPVIYDQLIAEYAEEYDDCTTEISQTTCSNDPNSLEESEIKPTNLVIIFDASGSMAGQVGTKSEMQIAQEAVKNYTSKLGSNINLSLVVYGHRGSNQEKDKVISCKGVEEVFALGQGESVAISNAVDKLAPTGYTPIAGALEKTGKILADYPALRYKNVALIISDGQETCGGDPAEQAERLYESEIELVTNVIGFDVGGAAEAELTDIAFSGGGEYYDVSYEAEMITALNQFADWQEMFACQTEENLRTLNEYLDINNRNFECTHRLNMEKFALEMEFNLLNINYDNHGEEVQRACGEYIVDNYQQRFNRIKSAIIEAYESQKQAILTNQAKFDQLIDSQFADQDADDREGYGDIEGDEFYTRQELEEEFDEFEFELR